MNQPAVKSDRFILSRFGARDRDKLLIRAVVPRPNAWVTTVDEQAVRTRPPSDSSTACRRNRRSLLLELRTMPTYDSTTPSQHPRNRRIHRQYRGLCKPRGDKSYSHQLSLRRGQLEAAGLTMTLGEFAAFAQISEATIRFESNRQVTLNLDKSREIVLGELLAMFARPGLVNSRVDVATAALDAFGQIGGLGYCRSFETFDVPTRNGARQTLSPRRKSNCSCIY